MNTRPSRIGLALIAALCATLSACSDSDKPKKPSVQTIAVLRPPPPPPPPKPEEKPPEPEVKKEEVKLPDPEPQKADSPDEPPPSQNLGVDAEGGAGSDGFGLEGRPGGRDITTIGDTGNGGAGRAQFNAFAGYVQMRIQEQLQKRDRLRQSDYRAVVRVWFSERGAIEKVELVDGSGDAELDTAIRSALLDLKALDQTPPEGMPQPLKLKLTSRSAG